MEDDKKQPLSGIRVLDLGTMVAGPVAATLLADFGAEVIKLEQPGKGDPIRHSGPFADGESLYWHVEGRNKKSVTLDLHVPQGQALLRELVKHVDVLIENFRPGTMDKWNVGWATLREINPRLIMLSVSGFGQTGPYASRPAYDRVALAFSGFLNMTGYPDRAPVRPGSAVADYQAALMGAFAVALSLYDRDKQGGTGRQIDVSLYEAVLRFTDVMVTAYAKLGTKRERRGNSHFAAAPGDHYETNDGRYIALTISADNVFRRLCQALARPELGVDAKFATHANRVANYAEINGIVADWIREQSVEHVCAQLTENGVPHALIYSVQDIVTDPHYAARGSLATIDHPKLGALKMPGILPRIGDALPPPLRAAPELGAHTEEVLREWLGYTQARLDELRGVGAI